MGRPAGAPGRGRWKIGWPGTGRPGMGRGAIEAEGAVGAGRGGALYTGRGPVCGTIMRGKGVVGAGGRVAIGVCGRGAIGDGGAIVGAAGVGTAACAIGRRIPPAHLAVQRLRRRSRVRRPNGLRGNDQPRRRGYRRLRRFRNRRLTTGGAATTGLLSTGVGTAAGRADAGGGVDGAPGACCLRIRFNTSPGLEMCDKSILVLISSPSAREGREVRAGSLRLIAFAESRLAPSPLHVLPENWNAFSSR